MSEAAFRRVQGQIPANNAQALACADGSRPKVLLAEDSMAARILTAALLRRMGCEVDAVEHGEEAVTHVQAANYDVVLMDIEMPVMDGLLAAREIRALGGAAAKTPIIALSAFMADSRKAPMWRESFNVSLPKPAGRDQLRRVIQATLDAQPAQVSAVKPADGSKCELGGLIDEDEIASFKSQMSPGQLNGLLKTACDEMAATADELVKATHDNQLEAAKRAAHKLRGIAATFAAPRLIKIAHRFENAAELNNTGNISALAGQVQDCAEQTVSALFAAAK